VCSGNKEREYKTTITVVMIITCVVTTKIGIADRGSTTDFVLYPSEYLRPVILARSARSCNPRCYIQCAVNVFELAFRC
jgi:hypothetical protein